MCVKMKTCQGLQQKTTTKIWKVVIFTMGKDDCYFSPGWCSFRCLSRETGPLGSKLLKSGEDGIAESSSVHIKNKVFWRLVSQISPPIFNRFFQLKLRVSIHLAGDHSIGKTNNLKKPIETTNTKGWQLFEGEKPEVKVF